MGPRTWGLIGIGLALVGIGGCRCDRADQRPPEGPKALVSLAWPGASASEVEQKLALPVEAALQSLPGLARLETRSSEGQLVAVVEGAGGSGRELAWRRAVVEALGDLAQGLPADVEAPVLLASARPASRLLVLGAELDRLGLQRLGRRLADELERLPGVAAVRLVGARERQVVVEVDPDLLRAYGLTAADLSRALRVATAELPAGSIATRKGELLVRAAPPSGGLGVRDLERLPLRTSADGSPIYLGDLARLSSGFADVPATEVLTPKGPGLVLSVQLGDGPAGREALSGLRDVLKRFALRAPAGVWLHELDLEGRSAGRLVIGRIEPPAGTSSERVAELLRPLRRGPDLLAGADGFAVIIGAADLPLPEVLAGHRVLVLAATDPRDTAGLVARLTDWAARTPDLQANFGRLDDLLRPGARVEFLVCADAPGPPAAEVAGWLDAIGEAVVWRGGLEPRPELSIALDRERLAQMGLRPDEVQRVIRQATSGEVVSELQAGRERVLVRLRLANQRAGDPEALTRIPVSAPGGQVVPLAQLARLERRLAPAEYLRIGGRRCVRLLVDPEAPWSESRVRSAVKRVGRGLPGGASLQARRL